MQIGNISLRNNVIVAPMAGVTDRPFRQLCKRLGAGYAVSEMTGSDSRLWNTRKSRNRRDHAYAARLAHAAVDGIFPDDLRRSVSILSTANFLGLPYETTRRHVGKLVELGMVERRGSREFFVSSAVLARPDFDPVATQTVNLARVLLRDAGGVLDASQMVEA